MFVSRAPAIFAALFSILIASCQGAELVPAPAAPELFLSSPVEGQLVPFDEPFVLSGTAIAPEGGTIIGVDLVLRGAIDDRRRIEVSGPLAEIASEIVVPSDDHLGPDRLPLELVLLPEALVDGAIKAGAPRGVTVAVVDRTEPELEISFSPNATPLAGFDAAVPEGEPFTLSVRATDPVGGIARLLIDAPRALGGARERRFPFVREAQLDVVFSPPANADLELEVTAEDAADDPNRTSRTLSIRVGRGGTDEIPPELTASETGPIECREVASFGAIAEDRSSGVEHVSIRGPAFEATAFGPDPDHPLTLSVTATAIAPGPAGDRLAYVAEAEDTLGNLATVSFSREMIDTRPPVLEHAAIAGTFAPGMPLDLLLFGEEACGVIDRVRVDFGGVTATKAIGASSIAGAISIDAPEAICVLEPIVARVELIDLENLVSQGATLSLAGPDLIPPRIAINRLVQGGLLPGDPLATEILIDDGQTPVRSATITVSASGLDLPDPWIVVGETWPAESCADRVARSIPIDLPIPADVRFTASTASLRISVEAIDKAGHAATAFAEIPVIDPFPPQILISGVQPGAVLFPGETAPIEVAVSDLHHDVASISVTASGPVSIDTAGVTTATRAVNAASASFDFDLLVDPAPPLLGAPITLEVTAIDSGGAIGSERVELSLCGTPLVTAVEPNVGPETGGIDVVVRGARFAEGATLRIAGVDLLNPTIESPSTARGRIPVGSHPLGPADVTVINDCGVASFSGTLAGGFRFAAPPAARFLRPVAGATAIALDALPISFAAIADGVPLERLEARIAGQPAAVMATNRTGDTLDAVLSVPASASGSIAVVGTAVDALGQISVVTTNVSIGPPAPVRLSLELDRELVAAGETIGVTAISDGTDGRKRQVTAQATLVSSDPAIVEIAGAAAIRGVAPGIASITATYDGLSATADVRVLDDAIAIVGPPLLMSPLAGSSTAGLEVRSFSGGASTDVSAQVALTSLDPSIVQINGRSIAAISAGETTVLATLGGLSASIAVRASDRIDIAPDEVRSIPSGQRFTGGVVEGTAIARFDRGAWRIEIDAGPLAIARTGRVVARGRAGSPLASGGAGAAGAGGGGAGTQTGGAAGGAGDPSGASTLDDLATTLGGDGGAGGQGARANAGSAGAGGGGAGAGGIGGHPNGVQAAQGGTARGSDAGGGGGGGGRRAGGGGGGGARVVIDAVAATIEVLGSIDAGGGAGGSGLTGTAGGGGGGGSIRIEARELLGDGTLIASGGAGGNLSPGGVRGSGGGGGGGSITFVIATEPSPFLDADVQGGEAVPATGGALPGGRGQHGSISR